MKPKVTFLSLILTFLTGTALALPLKMTCKDTMRTGFKGQFFAFTDVRFIKQLYFSDTLYRDQPRYKLVNNLTPDPANKYVRGGSDYTADLPTSKGLVKVKISLNTPGDNMAISTPDGDIFDLTCE